MVRVRGFGRLGLVVLGGCVCGAIGATDGVDGLVVATTWIFFPLLALAVPGAGLYWFLNAEGGAVAGLVGFVGTSTFPIMTTLPLLFLPFAAGSAFGGAISGRIRHRRDVPGE